MRKTAITLVLMEIFFLFTCARGWSISPVSRTINVKASLASKPEKNIKVYVVEGTAVGSYKKRGPGMMYPESVEYKTNERKFIGTTPLTTTLTFRHYPMRGGYIWTPPQYAVYFVEPSGRETSVAFGPWTILWTDTATGKTNEMLYNAKEFPFDYFNSHPNVGEMNVPFNFCLEIKEPDK